MKKLLIMRHGKSSWKDSSLSDHERPLKKRGRKDSARVGKHLKEKELIPDIILCSSAKRATQTAEIVSDEMDFEGNIEFIDSFYMADPEIFFTMLQTLPDVETVMIIGHNPGLETLLQILSDEIKSLPTAATAHLTLPIDSWAEIKMETDGKLIHLWRPRDLD